MSELVVVASFPNDIPSMIASDGSSSMEPQLQFTQGVRLLVHADDAEDARVLLAAEGRETEDGDELVSDEP
jgi:hypothetical protein